MGTRHLISPALAGKDVMMLLPGMIRLQHKHRAPAQLSHDRGAHGARVLRVVEVTYVCIDLTVCISNSKATVRTLFFHYFWKTTHACAS